MTGHKTGDNLLSHPSVGALPLAVEGLTSVFEMGTCVSPHLYSPDWLRLRTLYGYRAYRPSQAEIITVIVIAHGDTL